MSSIFVPELAKLEAKRFLPNKFETAINKLKHKASFKHQANSAINSISNREERIWSQWVNLCVGSSLKGKYNVL
jgi:hypothetical protein